MNHQDKDELDYDDLFASKWQSVSPSYYDDDFVPIGAGKKKSQTIKTSPSSEHAEIAMPVRKKSPSSVSSQTVRKKKLTAGAESPGKKNGATSAKNHSAAAKRAALQSGAVSKKGSATPKKPPSKKQSVPPSPQSAMEDMLLVTYMGVTAVGGGIKSFFGRRRNAAMAAAAVGGIILLSCAMAVKAMYSSNTLFADRGKALDEGSIQERLITSEQNRDKVTYFLIAGVDKSSMLTDCVWVMCLDNQAHKMNVMQVPRDTYVGEDSIYPHKLNAVYESPKTVSWCEKCGVRVEDDEIDAGRHTLCSNEITSRTESNINSLIRCINTRLSLPIDHYVLFDFDGFEKVIDAMGGVDITLEEEMKVYPNKTDYVNLPAGPNHLDGSTALKFMRNRKIYAEGDLGRVKAQRRIIHAMMEKVDAMSTVDALNVLIAAYGSFKTDMSLEEIRSFIAPVKKCGADSLNMFEMPGSVYWVTGHPSYYVCDEEKTLEAINEYMLPYSEKLAADDITFPALGY